MNLVVSGLFFYWCWSHSQTWLLVSSTKQMLYADFEMLSNSVDVVPNLIDFEMFWSEIFWAICQYFPQQNKCYMLILRCYLIQLMQSQTSLILTCFKVKYFSENIFLFSSVCLQVNHSQTYKIFSVDSKNLYKNL